MSNLYSEGEVGTPAKNAEPLPDAAEAMKAEIMRLVNIWGSAAGGVDFDPENTGKVEYAALKDKVNALCGELAWRRKEMGKLIEAIASPESDSAP